MSRWNEMEVCFIALVSRQRWVAGKVKQEVFRLCGPCRCELLTDPYSISFTPAFSSPYSSPRRHFSHNMRAVFLPPFIKTNEYPAQSRMYGVQLTGPLVCTLTMLLIMQEHASEAWAPKMHVNSDGRPAYKLQRRLIYNR